MYIYIYIIKVDLHSIINKCKVNRKLKFINVKLNRVKKEI